MYRHVVGHAHPQASPGAHQPRARIAPPARPRNLQGGQFLTRACMSRTRTRVHKFVRGAQSRCQHVCVSPATLTGKCCPAGRGGLHRVRCRALSAGLGAQGVGPPEPLLLQRSHVCLFRQHIPPSTLCDIIPITFSRLCAAVARMNDSNVEGADTTTSPTSKN